VNSCSDEQYTKEQAEELFYDPECATADEPIHFCTTEAVCESDFVKKGRAKPWGWAEACGRYLNAEQVPVDIAEVEAKFGKVTGVRTSPWGLAASLRAGFEKMRGIGLEVDPDTLEVPDPDQAFAYLVAMTVSENVWLEIVGTPLTIPTRFPRNAAARVLGQHLRPFRIFQSEVAGGSVRQPIPQLGGTKGGLWGSVRGACGIRPLGDCGSRSDEA